MDNVRDEVDSADLLEHLVHVGQNGAVEVAVLGASEEVAEAALRHLHDRVLDGEELVLDVRVVTWRRVSNPLPQMCEIINLRLPLIQCAKHLNGLLFLALEN